MVSIIMPSFNTANFISLSIASVINQTYTDWELIIVDDCSTDNTKEVVSQFNDKRIRFYNNLCNSGAAISRNKAISLAKGEWIAFLDSDDIWHPQKLEKQLNFMLNNNYVFSYHTYDKIQENGDACNILVTGPKVINIKKMYHYGYPGCLTVMYNANFFGKIQIEDIKKNNDYAILLKLIKKSNCYFLNENLASYRIRKKSISHDNFFKKVKTHYQLFRICEGKNVFLSVFYATSNMFYGFLKKIKYENKIKRR